MTQGYRGFQSSITLLLDCTDSVLSVAANVFLQQQLPQNAALVSTEFWENFQEIQYVKCVLLVSTGSFAFIWMAEIASDSFVICNNEIGWLREKENQKECGFALARGWVVVRQHDPLSPIAQMEVPEHSVLSDWATKLVLKAKDYTKATSESISR